MGRVLREIVLFVFDAHLAAANHLRNGIFHQAAFSTFLIAPKSRLMGDQLTCLSREKKYFLHFCDILFQNNFWRKSRARS